MDSNEWPISHRDKNYIKNGTRWLNKILIKYDIDQQVTLFDISFYVVVIKDNGILSMDITKSPGWALNCRTRELYANICLQLPLYTFLYTYVYMKKETTWCDLLCFYINVPQKDIV